MLPDGPTTSELEMTLPKLTLTLNRQLHSTSSTMPAPTTEDLTDSREILIETIFPGIYFSKLARFWTTEKLRCHGITHVINIDRHIHEKLQQLKELSSTCHEVMLPCTTPLAASSTVAISESISKSITSLNKQYLCEKQNSTNNCTVAPVQTLDLNFGEESFLTTVLPNCYKAVKFIEKALHTGGAILVIDQFNDQKCLTIIIGYLMYKNNINFNEAFQRLKSVFKKAELEPFFISQLYEYEPILQVERAQSRGHSCSRELRSAQLKRKKLSDDPFYPQSDWHSNYQSAVPATNNFYSHHHFHHQFVINENSSSDVVME